MTTQKNKMVTRGRGNSQGLIKRFTFIVRDHVYTVIQTSNDLFRAG